MVDAYNIEIVGSDIDTQRSPRPGGLFNARSLAKLPGQGGRSYFEPSIGTAARSSTICASRCASPPST
jgi:hypothetical protein